MPVSSQDLRPAEVPEALNRAIQIHSSGNLAGAKEIYRQVLQADPHNEDALHLVGLTSLQEGNLDEAEEFILKALDENPDFPAAYNNLGTVYSKMGRLDDAAANYRKAIERQENFPSAHYNLGNVLRDKGQPAEVEASYRKAIVCKPDYVDAYNNLGVYLTNLGRLDEAVECFCQIVHLNPDYVDAYYNLGNAFRDLGQFDKAAENYRQVLELDPEHLKAHHVLAALTDNLTEMPPDGYVSLVFDNFASEFEQQMTIGNCRIPETLREIVGKVLEERRHVSGPAFPRVLDMGCGTGLAGQVFREIAEELHGVDLSEKMLERAREKNVYDEIFQAPIEKFLDQPQEPYDLVIAADVLIYIGPLEALFEKVAKRLGKKGLFAFSVEGLDVGTYVLQPSTRYAHSENYVHRVARDYGFNLIGGRPVQKMRNDVNGNLFLLEKSN